MRELAASPEPVESRLARFLELGFGSLRQYLPLLRGMLFESSQMNILQNGIDEFCVLVERILGERRRETARLAVDPSLRKILVRTTVLGVLFSAALAKPERVEEEIDDLRRTVTLLLAGG
jgi:hypothetical protein